MTKIVALVMALTAPTFVHSWYPPKCCSGQDCAPVDCHELLETADGGFSWSGLVFKKVFKEMSENDATVGAVLSAFGLILRAVEWRTEPADERGSERPRPNQLSKILTQLASLP
jgi:hypothetical protein